MDLRRLHATNDPVALIVNDFDRVHSLGRTTSGSAFSACYGCQLVAQEGVHALRKARADGSGAFTGGKPDPIVGRNRDAHAPAYQAAITIRPSRSKLPNHALSKPLPGRRWNGDFYARVYAENMPRGLIALPARCSVAGRTVSDGESVT